MVASRYSSLSIALHWIIAALVVLQIVLIAISDEVRGPDRGFWIMLHKSGGLTILALTLVRIGLRLREPWMPLPTGTPIWQRILARTTHVGFYVLLIAMPLGGWIASSAAGRDILWYGLFEWPLLPVPADRDLARQIMEGHSTLAKALYVLAAAHVLGALKHYFIDRDGVLGRMLPVSWARPRG